MFAYCTFPSNFTSQFIVVLTPCPVYMVCTIVAIAVKIVFTMYLLIFVSCTFFPNFSLVLLMILSLCPDFRAHMSVIIELRTVFVILSSTNEGMNALAQSNLYQTICAPTALFQPLFLFSHMKMGKMWLRTGRGYIISFDVIVVGHPCPLGPLDGVVNLLKISIHFYCESHIYHGDSTN